MTFAATLVHVVVVSMDVCVTTIQKCNFGIAFRLGLPGQVEVQQSPLQHPHHLEEPKNSPLQIS